MLAKGSDFWKVQPEMRIAVTGRGGQLASALLEKAAAMPDVSLMAFVRAAVDLGHPDSVLPAVRSVKPDIIVNAAAYTAVDQAESEPDVAMAVNGAGAGAVAAAARTLGIPVVQISTDYVFDGTSALPYRETDGVNPVSAYGRSKLEGERAVAAANKDHVILRAAWIYAAEGKNFLRTMLRLAETRPEIGVVADQFGAPGYAPDLAEAVLGVCRNLLASPQRADMRGIFHMAGAGEVTWADFAESIFAGSAKRGGPSAAVRRITTAEYPTPAQRPANARLDCSKLLTVHGITLPDWRESLEACLDRVFAKDRSA
jgi:dTDP-4-dehydrorhamnose reductase